MTVGSHFPPNVRRATLILATKPSTVTTLGAPSSLRQSTSGSWWTNQNASITLQVTITTPSISILSLIDMGKFLLIKAALWSVNLVGFFIAYRLMMSDFHEMEIKLFGLMKALTLRLKQAVRNRLGLSADDFVFQEINFLQALINFFVKGIKDFEEARKKFFRKSNEVELDAKRKYSVRVWSDRRKSARLSNQFGKV